MNSKLHFMCGKMAAGKSTFSKELIKEYNAVLFSEDELLKKLYPDEIKTIEDYVKYSIRLKSMLKDTIIELLNKGIDVVLDFPANTLKQRDWFKEIFIESKAEHCMYYVKRSNEICKKQLKIRNKNKSSAEQLMDEKNF